MRDGRVGVLGGTKNIVTIDTERHGYSFCRVQVAFSKSRSCLSESAKPACRLHF